MFREVPSSLMQDAEICRMPIRVIETLEILVVVDLLAIFDFDSLLSSTGEYGRI